MAKASRNYSMIKQMMVITYKHRRIAIVDAAPGAESVASTLDTYPALQLFTELKLEISRVMEETDMVGKMESKVKPLLPKILEYAKSEAKDITRDLRERQEEFPERKQELQEIMAVLAIPAILKDRKENNAIKICEEGEDIDDAIKKSVFPRLVGCWNNGTLDPLYIIAEGSKVMKFTNANLPMAVALLLGTYYVFNIAYPAGGSNVYAFLEAILLVKDREARKRVRIQKILSNLV